MISSCDIKHHLYADDIQIDVPISFKRYGISREEVATVFNGCIGLDDRIQAEASSWENKISSHWVHTSVTKKN